MSFFNDQQTNVMEKVFDFASIREFETIKKHFVFIRGGNQFLKPYCRPKTKTGKAIWALADLGTQIYWTSSPEFLNLKAQMRSLAGLK